MSNAVTVQLSPEVVLGELKKQRVTHIVWLPDSETNWLYLLMKAEPGLSLVAVARERAAVGGYSPEMIDFVVGDAAAWESGGFSPDLLVSRHGVMFFAQPVAAFAHLRNLAAPQANLAFTCFRAAQINPWANELADLLPDGFAVPVDPVAPGPFAFADARRVEDILYRAGWQDIGFEPLDFTYVMGAGPDPVMDAAEFLGRIGMAARALRILPDAERRALLARIMSWLEANRRGDEIAFAGAAWMVTAC